MAEVYDPSNPYGGWVEDPSNTGAQIWDPYYYGYGGGGTDDSNFSGWDPNYFGQYGTDLLNPFTSVDPSNPYDLSNPYNTAPTGIYVGDTLTGDVGTNPYGIDFGTSGGSIDPYTGILGGTTVQGTGFTEGHGSLEGDNPTYYPGSQWPNIGVGIPGLIGIGLGGIVYGGGWDILTGGGGGTTVGPTSGGQQTDPNAVLPPPGVYEDSGATVGTGGDTPTNEVYPPPGVYGDSGATVGPGAGGEQDTSGTVYPLPGVYDPNPQATVNPAEATTGPGTILPPPIITPPTGTTENPTKSTIVPPPIPPTTTPIVPVVGDGGGGSNPPTMSTQTPITIGTPDLRNLQWEGDTSNTALGTITPNTLKNYYGAVSGPYNPGAVDMNAFTALLGQQGMGGYNPTLTALANEQTIASNSALRAANMADVSKWGQQARNIQMQANPELYGMLGTYAPYAQDRLWQDAEQVRQKGKLTADDIRMAQQGAREAGAASGRLRDASVTAAEVLNREQFRQQREQTARANLGQSQQAALQGMGMAQAASFNPFNTILGAQYGQQTQNVGLNQALFGQGAGFQSGQFSNPFVQGLVNPFSAYANDVYGSNFNAANARLIAQANAQGLQQGANAQLIGQFGGTALNAILKYYGLG